MTALLLLLAYVAVATTAAAAVDASPSVLFTDTFDQYFVGQAPPAPWDTTASKGA